MHATTADVVHIDGTPCHGDPCCGEGLTAADAVALAAPQVDRHNDGSPVAAPAHATAAQVVAVAEAYRDFRVGAEREDIAYGGWSDPDAGRRYVDVLTGLVFVAFDERHVVAVAPDTSDGRVWSYVGSHILDYAAQLLHDAHLADIGERATILTWTPERPSEDLTEEDFAATV